MLAGLLTLLICTRRRQCLEVTSASKTGKFVIASGDLTIVLGASVEDVRETKTITLPRRILEMEYP